MNVMELIEEITETTKIAALNLWGTNRERTNIAIDECAQRMKDIRLKANKDKLDEVILLSFIIVAENLDHKSIEIRSFVITVLSGFTNLQSWTKML